MQLHPTETNPTENALLVCRNARFGLLILLAIFWAMPIFWWWVDVRIVFYLTFALALMLTPLFIGSWRNRGRADNWVLALYNDGLWVNLRDCEYHRAKSGETILFLSYEEVVSVQKTILRYTTPDSDGDNTHHKSVFLDMQIALDDPESLHNALRADKRRRPIPREYLGGCLSIGLGKIKRAPVEFLSEDLLRIKFSTNNYGLIPGWKKVLAVLGKYVAIENEQLLHRGEWQEMDDTQFNQFIRDLVRDGSDVTSISLLRRRQGMTTTEAHNFIQEIRNQLASKTESNEA